MLSNVVATSYMQLFKFKTMKIHFFKCTSHISSAQEIYVSRTHKEPHPHEVSLWALLTNSNRNMLLIVFVAWSLRQKNEQNVHLRLGEIK